MITYLSDYFNSKVKNINRLKSNELLSTAGEAIYFRDVQVFYGYKSNRRVQKNFNINTLYF